MNEKIERRLYQISGIVILLLLAGLLLYFYIYNQGFEEGKHEGYSEGFGYYEEMVNNSIETNEAFSLNWRDVKCEKVERLVRDNNNWTIRGYWI